MNLIVPLITLLTLPPFNNAISPSEQTTLINAVNVVLFKQQLSALVAKCGGMLNDIDEVDTSETDRLIREKLKIDISKFISIANVESRYFIDSLADIQNSNCDSIDPTGQFEQAKENYEMALFRLSISSDFSEPFQSQAELQTQAKTDFVKLIRAKKESAHIIVIGKLIETSTVPDKYRGSFLPKHNPSAFTYSLEKGWKTPSAKFVIAERRSHEGLKYEESLKIVNEGAEFIFFIDQYNRIQDQIRVIDSTLVLQELGKTDWYWSGGDLIKEPR